MTLFNRSNVKASIAFTALISLAQASVAEELAEGTIIDENNIDALQDSTFEGHPISELIPPSLARLVREYKLTMPLKHSTKRPMEISQKWWDATEKYSPDVTYDPATRNISNYVAGTPFPGLTVDTPHAGDKAMYNVFWNFGMFGANLSGDFPFLFIDADKGVERTQLWREATVSYSGLGAEPHTLPIGKKRLVQKRDALFALEPFDIKGLGSFTQRYSDGRSDDTWVYIRSIRRTRRVSGGSWSDALGGSDIHLDDINGFNAHPTWFESAKLVRKQSMLVWFIDKPQQNPEGNALNDRFPTIKLDEWPHWNTVQQWQPAEVNVIEITPKKSHPFYSKKVLYELTEYPGAPFLMLAWDKQGELWKVYTISRGQKKDSDGDSWFSGFVGLMVDLKYRHATIAVGDEVTADNSVVPSEINQNILIVQ